MELPTARRCWNVDSEVFDDKPFDRSMVGVVRDVQRDAYRE
ncbi:MAG: hypothetical protein R3E01_33225 [Pirellulaceae bacterium]